MIASFREAEAFERAVERYVREDAAWSVQVFTPHPMESLDALVAYRPSPIPKIIFWGFICGAFGGYLMQVYASVWAYPLNVAGRPLHSWPAFIPITFELGVLTAALTGLITWLIRLRPRLYVPELDSPLIARGTQDRYVLLMVPTGDVSEEELRHQQRQLSNAGAEETEVRRWN
ncbi:MAG: DUF3341 domain-containing protein [Verrucomicrobiota bacterium JB022]|nr:DUF3341 domain-containing protein [Verrucomicrobiota bacterium JB022]